MKKAEDLLRDRHRHAPRPDRDEQLPRNFGALREVVASDVAIDLAEVLPDGADVTDPFRDLRPISTDPTPSGPKEWQR